MPAPLPPSLRDRFKAHLRRISASSLILRSALITSVLQDISLTKLVML